MTQSGYGDIFDRYVDTVPETRRNGGTMRIGASF